MLDGPRAAAALTVAGQTAQRLGDPVRLQQSQLAMPAQTSFASIQRWRPDSLACGDAGMALFAAAAADHVPAVAWDRVTHRHLGRAAEIRASSLSLFSGVTGLAAAVSIRRHRGGYQRLSRQLRSYLLPRMQAAATAATAAPAAMPSGSFDLINGFAGWCAYLLTEERTPDVDETMSAVGHALAAPLRPNGQPQLPTRPAELSPEERAQAPHGYLNCGMAHGISAVVAALALLHSDGRVKVDGLAEALRIGSDWLAERAAAVADGSGWPRVVLLEPDGQLGAPVEAVRPTWCSGAAGAARALWLAGAALDEESYRRRAVEVLQAAIAPAAAERLISPTLCHGLAGLVLVTACFCWEGADPALRTPLASLVDRLIDAYEPATPLGYRDVENTGARVDNPGLLNGAAGVALTLLAVTGSAPPAWSRLLLLA